VHGKLVLAGPVFIFVLVALALTASLAVYVVVDSLRRGPGAFSRIPEPQWLYTVPQLAYAALFVLSLVPVVTSAVGLALVIATPFVFAEQVAYLLRVVFPKPVTPGT
jgi:hypothetical protein